jgi:hypothetical protein
VNHKVHGSNSLRFRSFVPYLRKDSHYSKHCAWIKFSFVFYFFCECVVFQVHLLLCCFCIFFFFFFLFCTMCIVAMKKTKLIVMVDDLNFGI